MNQFEVFWLNGHQTFLAIQYEKLTIQTSCLIPKGKNRLHYAGTCSLEDWLIAISCGTLDMSPLNAVSGLIYSGTTEPSLWRIQWNCSIQGSSSCPGLGRDWRSRSHNSGCPWYDIVLWNTRRRHCRADPSRACASQMSAGLGHTPDSLQCNGSGSAENCNANCANPLHQKTRLDNEIDSIEPTKTLHFCRQTWHSRSDSTMSAPFTTEPLSLASCRKYPVPPDIDQWSQSGTTELSRIAS